MKEPHIIPSRLPFQSLVEKIGRENIVDFNNIPNYMETIMTDILKEVQGKKDALVKQKLIEKGFEHLIEGMEKKLFPKVCSFRYEGWTYFFADNDTDDGCFIVAIQDLQFNYDSQDVDARINMNATFNYQDKMAVNIKRE